MFGKIAVVFGTPIYVSSIQGDNKREFRQQVSQKIEKSLKELKAWCEKGFEGSVP